MIAANALEAIIALFFLLALIYGPWQWACTDIARHKMFSGRDALFDMARAGDLDFASSEYQIIRSELNNMIRFAHGLTVLRLVMFAKLARRRQNREVPIYTAVGKIQNKEVRKRVSAIIHDVEMSAVQMLILKSPIILLLSVVTVVPVILAAAAYFSAKGFLKDTASEIAKTIQSEADLLRA